MGKPGIREEEVEGRISGSLEWKEARGEMGDGSKVSTSAIDSTVMKFPIIAEFPVSSFKLSSSSSSSSSSITTSEIDILGIGLSQVLDDDTILKCNQTAISLLTFGWFDCCSNTIIIDPINGNLIIDNYGDFISTNFICNPSENQKRISQIFKSDYKLGDIESIKFLLKKERLIVFHQNSSKHDTLCSLVSCGYLSRSKLIISTPNSLSNVKNDNSVIMKYISLGGQIHPDTIPFDTTAFLSPIFELLSTNTDNVSEKKLQAWKQFTISQVTILASSMLTNGFQVHYKIPFVLSSLCPTNVIPSPLFASYCDNPISRFLSLMHEDIDDDKISNITVNCGALVDRIELTTINNTIFCCGGNGGNSKSFKIPDGWELCGFFGGTGGHLHNFGIIIKKNDQRREPNIPLVSIKSRQDINIMTVFDLMMKYNLFDHRYFNAGLLINIITIIFEHNDRDSRKRLLSACAIYAINLTYGINFRTVNKDNIFFNRIIMTAIGKIFYNNSNNFN
jgi:hypothetical protein